MLYKWAAQLKAGEEDEDEENGTHSATRLIELKWLPRLAAASQWGQADARRRWLAALAQRESSSAHPHGAGGDDYADGGAAADGGGLLRQPRRRPGGGYGGALPQWVGSGGGALQRSDLAGLPGATRALTDGLW